MKIIGMAECRFCGRAIEWQDWGNGGRVWKHSDGRADCVIPTRATPPIDWEPVTPSRTDRQPPTSVADAKGGSNAVGPDDTKRPDLVTRPEGAS